MEKGGLRLLVKTSAGPGVSKLALGPQQAQLKLERLFASVEAPARARLRAAATPTWHIATAPDIGVGPWDACHALVTQGLQLSGAPAVAFAEPDLEQQWMWTTPARQALGMSGECGLPEPQDSDVYAVGPTRFWFRERGFSQLDDARLAVAAPAAQHRIRIAHLDTGYDPKHVTRPKFLRDDLQRNFADEDRPGDATDEPTAIVNPMFGHGTATIALLAGSALDGTPLGAAANLEVVPIRVANLVVLFRNSAIAKALDYVHGLWGRPADRVHVVTMSMGGIASAAWADAVNALYERGIVVVTAAGNNFGNLPTRYIVYPARFRRVLAACGVMADGRPYADLPIRKMAGCYGPARKEASALAAFTPNVPWAKIGCPDLIDLDGGGTSAATPQIAAAAALWLQQHKAMVDAYPEGWMRVEAVRKALFDSAKAVDPETARRLGRGILQAGQALAAKPARTDHLVKEDVDTASFGLFRVLTGLGVKAKPSARQMMLELESLQISQQSHDIETILEGRDPDDPAFVESGGMRPLMEALADHPAASKVLKNVVASRLRTGAMLMPQPGGADQAVDATAEPAPVAQPAASSAIGASRPLAPAVPAPPSRGLRVYAFDPLLGTRLETIDINEAVLKVRWEASLAPGPIGEYFEVIDVDPPSGHAYAPVDLNDPSILAQQGLAPTEGNPQFHQQMVYAVAMKTVEHFERALGRAALWAERKVVVDGKIESRFVRRLRIYPHGLREANAFYSPERAALLFGYFNASRKEPGDNLPGGLIFTCLSHDIVAHETTHALLDGLHPRFKEPTGLDMLAFHEAFADIVALFQHFTLPEALRDQIAVHRGDLTLAELLGGLAMQFGQGIGNRGALRNALMTVNEDTGKLELARPSPRDYEAHTEPHARGAVLVAAVFDAFLQIYRRKTEDLYRLASSGTGVLPPGRIAHDLVERLAAEASKIAGRVLTICIRALDYCPPVDLTFGEYLRALITADRDLVPDDDRGYRVAFIAAFRARGIFPVDVGNLSVDALVWQKPDITLHGMAAILGKMALSWKRSSDRYDAFLSSNRDAKALHNAFVGGDIDDRTFAALGLVKTRNRRKVVIDGVEGSISPIEMHSVRPVSRIGPDGQLLNNVVIEMTQRWKPVDGGGESFRGGCTLICDRDSGEVRYVIRKRVGHRDRVAAQLEFRMGMAEASLLRNYFEDDKSRAEPFAMRHRYF